MTSDYYDPDEPMNRTPPLVAAVPKYAVDEDPPPFVRNGEFPRVRQGNARSFPPIARDDPLEVSPKRGRPRDLDHYRRNGPAAPPIPPVQEAKEEQKDSTTAATPSTSADKEPNPRSPGHKTTLPPILPSNPSLESPPQRRRFPSIHAPPLPNLLPPHERRASLDRPVLNPPTEVKSRFSVPSLQPLPSIHSPPSSSAATSPETVNNTPLPSISALGLNKSDVSASPYNAFSPLSYAGPGVPTPRESPLDRHLPSLIPPSPYTHYSPVSALSAKDASNNPSPASQPATWRTPTSAVAPTALPPPPPPAPSEPPVPQSPYEMSPVTAKSPATNYPTPTEQIAPGVAGQSTFSANMMANGVPTGVGHYKCEHPGCTAAPFQTQYLLK
ncbi:hypothetical protein N7470_008061 [Penicillium chermesinum]|nr:hypothetical protein N7470_008061 [Penicillium chermesinum]